MKAIKERSEQTAVQPLTSRSRLGALSDRLFSPVDIASLVFFRVAFAGIMLWEVIYYLAQGWVEAYWVQPAFHFTYTGFEWVKPLPEPGMTLVFLGLGAFSIMMIVGLWYRVAAALFFMGFTYTFLLEQTRYLNHFYLVILFAFLLIFIPAHRALSLDARANPRLRSETVPAWSLWLLRTQMGLVYFFSGIAKINTDWLLRAEPLKTWLGQATDFPLIGGLFTQEWLIYLFAWGSMLLDLLAFPLLVWRKTRVPTFVLLVLFHVMNAIWLHIGIFPWMAIAATLMFFPPDLPRRLVERFRERRPQRRLGSARRRASEEEIRPPARRRLTVALLTAFVAVQVLVPLRHFLYPGEAAWTEEGQHFAWRMMLRDKQAELTRFFVTRPDTGETFEVDSSSYLAFWQLFPMSTRPYLILQFAQYLGDTFSPPTGPRVEVRAYSVVALNFRQKQLMVDPRVDLTKEDMGGLGTADWIVPLGSDLDIPPPEV